MSATAIDFYVIVFPDPTYVPPGSSFWWEIVPKNISFEQQITANLQTLSTNDADPDGVIKGLLYVPDIDPSDPCFALINEVLPPNVTRQANLPNTNFNIVALAPWISASCTRSFLASAHYDPIRAFIFYIPDNGTAQPPPISSPVWDMNDGGNWKSASLFPIYAVPGLVGSQMMTKLSRYSGNLSTVPYGHTLISQYDVDPRDYVRVFTEIDITAMSSLPALWVFLLIVAGGLLVILCTISLLMNVIQRQRRQRLRRRIARGQVDLEALGIKRLTVPRSVIDSFPLFIYTCTEDKVARESTTSGSSQKPNSDHELKATGTRQDSDNASPSIDPLEDMVVSLDNEELSKPSIAPHEYLQHSQPTCPICLEDFESGLTTIRELPCGHIFHPECIDSFLSNNSSLCPMCKKTTLPIGYYPERITNAMVRRERAIRRIRSRVTVVREDEHVGGIWTSWLSSMRSFGRRIVMRDDDPNPTGERPWLDPNFELRPPPAPLRVTPTWVEQQLGLPRQEITQQRMQDVLGDAVGGEDPEVVAEEHQSWWRKLISRVFPGFK